LKTYDHDSAPSRHVLAGMLADRKVVSRVAPLWDGKLFDTPWENLVGGWAVDHFKKYGKPLGRGVGAVFEEWAATQSGDAETVEMAERFLTAVSNAHRKNGKPASPEYLTDLAGRHWNSVRLQRLRDDIEAAVEAGKIDDALAKVVGFRPVETSSGNWIDVLGDRDFVREVFEHRSEVVVEPPGPKLAALKRFYSGRLERDGLVAFRGVEKRGKTYNMLEVCWWAMMQRRRVAFFEIGDLSKHQIGRRLLVRALGRPLNAQDKGDPPVRYPTYFDPAAGPPDFEERKFGTAASLKQAYAALEKVLGRVGGDKSLFRLQVHPTNSISIDQITSYLEREADRGWVADLVAIDYAKLLAPPRTGRRFDNSWQQVGENWASMRGLSQKLHCLVLTAAQGSAEAYDVDTIDERHYTGSKDENAYVTAMVGLNQTEDQKRDQVFSVNMFNAREIDYDKKRHCYVAGCLAVANPCVVASWHTGGAVSGVR
jgi:hypothetical protein